MTYLCVDGKDLVQMGKFKNALYSKILDKI